MVIKISPINKEPFIEEGYGYCKNGNYYINGNSYPAEIVDVIEQYRFVGIGPQDGEAVLEEDAFSYASENLYKISNKDEKDFIDWFFSGNWIRRKEKI